MPPSPVPSQPNGFNLLEVLIVLFILGLIAAWGIPSFLAANHKAQLEQSVNTIIAVLQEGQREAIRQNKTCGIKFDRLSNEISSSNGCLIYGSRKLNNSVSLNFTSNVTILTIDYGLRGNTTNNQTFILGIKDTPNVLRKCIALSAPLGITRIGQYNSSNQVCEKS
jgi:prepilin-type N-terminal cleavage/methylation domain-containing protein